MSLTCAHTQIPSFLSLTRWRCFFSIKSHPLPSPSACSALHRPPLIRLHLSLSSETRRKIPRNRQMKFPHDDVSPGWRLTENERLVLGILEEFPSLVFQSEARIRRSFVLNFSWGAKRKRSRPIGSATAAPAPAPAPALVPVETEPSKAWTDASSPDTPLIASYSGGSSEPKSSVAARRKSVKRSREELKLAETVALREKEHLEEKIQKLRRKIESAKSFNRELKRTKSRLVFLGQEKERAQWDQVNTSLTLSIISPQPHPAELHYSHVRIHDGRQAASVPSRRALGAGQGVHFLAGPMPVNLIVAPAPAPPRPLKRERLSFLDDLNMTVEENSLASKHSPLERTIPDGEWLKRMAAADARHRRYVKVKAKNLR